MRRKFPVENPAASEALGILLIFSPVLLVLLLEQQLRRSLISAWGLLFFIIPISVWRFLVAIPIHNQAQLYFLVDLCVYAALVLLLVLAMSKLGGWKRFVAVFTYSLILLVTGSNHVRDAVDLLRGPGIGHDLVDNRSLADVLKEIPVSGTLLVMNDTRYPGWEDEGTQFQLSGVFGHRAFNLEIKRSLMHGAELSTESSAQIYKDKLLAQKLFANRVWDDQMVETLLRKYPLTHYVVRRSFPHPRDIPLKLVASNDEFFVFEF